MADLLAIGVFPAILSLFDVWGLNLSVAVEMISLGAPSNSFFPRGEFVFLVIVVVETHTYTAQRHEEKAFFLPI